MDKKVFYGVRLNNYFSPSFCLNHKMYFGTLNNIREFIRSMGRSEESYILRKALKRYTSGETDVTHRVAYIQQKLIEDVELIAEGKVKLGATAWEFLNVWYRPQCMEFDSAVVKTVLIKYEDRYFRVIKASVRGLRTSPEVNRPKAQWIELSYGFWGASRNTEFCSRRRNIYSLQQPLYERKRVCNKRRSTSKISHRRGMP